MPNPSASRPAPPVTAAHGEHVGARVQRGKIGVGDAPEEVHVPAGLSLEPAPVAPGPGDRELRPGRVERRDIALITTSKPLRGTNRDTPSTSRRSGSRPKRRRVAARSAASTGWNRVAVDPGRDHDAGQRAAGGVGRGARRIRTGRHDRRRAAHARVEPTVGFRASARTR